MKKVLAILLTAALTLCIFGACAKQEPEAETTESTTQEVTSTTEESTTETTTETTTESTTTKKAEKSFDEWTVKDLAKYFKKEKVFTNEEYLGVYTDPDSLPDGINAEIEYNNHGNDENYVIIFYFDENSKNAKTEEIYNKIKKDRYFEWEGSGRQQPFNALVGRFAIFYSASIDENFVKDFEKALDKLIKDKKLKPDFYEKDLDLTKYKQGDDVIFIEGDD